MRNAAISPQGRRWRLARALVLAVLLCWLAAQGLGWVHRLAHGVGVSEDSPSRGVPTRTLLGDSTRTLEVQEGAAEASPAVAGVLDHERGSLCQIFDHALLADTLASAWGSLPAVHLLAPEYTQPVLAAPAVQPAAACARGPPLA